MNNHETALLILAANAMRAIIQTDPKMPPQNVATKAYEYADWMIAKYNEAVLSGKTREADAMLAEREKGK